MNSPGSTRRKIASRRQQNQMTPKKRETPEQIRRNIHRRWAKSWTPSWTKRWCQSLGKKTPESCVLCFTPRSSQSRWPESATSSWKFKQETSVCLEELHTSLKFLCYFAFVPSWSCSRDVSFSQQLNRMAKHFYLESVNNISGTALTRTLSHFRMAKC